MINIQQSQLFCEEPIELIENYEEAVNDTTQVWHCHHRDEITYNLSRDELKNMGLYYKLPAEKLIFLTRLEHFRKHHKGKKNSEETKKKISESKKGCKNPMYGKKMSFETRKKIGESLINNIKSSKPILQFTKNGEFVAEYPSLSECYRKTGIDISNICCVLKGKYKQSKGYIFIYKE